jgi:anti-sigma factor RsiW
VQQHLGDCACCRALLAELERTRMTLRPAPQLRAPVHLRTRIDALLDEEAVAAARRAQPRPWRSRPFWLGAFAGLAASAAALAVMMFVFLPVAYSPLADDLLAAHLHSLTGEHLIEVISSDQHTVKPWFAGRADVSPTVGDFAAHGFPLAGGRMEKLSGRRSAVMVYRHGAHVVNVFAWPESALALPRTTSRSGYRMLFWRIGDVAYCAVSDAAWSELTALEDLVRAQATAEQRSAPR